MSSRTIWMIIIILCFLEQAFANERVMECASNKLDMLAIPVKTTRSYGSYACRTSLDIRNTSLCERSSLELTYSQLVMAQLYQQGASYFKLIDSTATTHKITLLHDSTIKLIDSTLTTRGENVLVSGAKFDLITSNMTIEGKLSTIFSKTAVRLSDNSALNVKGNITLKLNSPIPPEVSVIELSKKSSVHFSDSEIDIRVGKGIYIPTNYSASLFNMTDNTSKKKGSFQLANNRSKSRIFKISSGGRITRLSNNKAYSQAASEGEAKVVAAVLDSLIPVAEANPMSNDAKTLAYFDSLSDQKIYDQEVINYSRWGSVGRAYPDTFFSTVVPDKQGFIFLSLAFGVGLVIRWLNLGLFPIHQRVIY